MYEFPKEGKGEKAWIVEHETMLLILLTELIVNDVSEVIHFMSVHFAERGVNANLVNNI